MTTNDKTRQKLVDSMRKTKLPENKKSTDAVSSDTSNATDRNLQTDNANKIKKTTVAEDSTQVSTDAYQSRGRIWPD